MLHDLELSRGLFPVVPLPISPIPGGQQHDSVRYNRANRAKHKCGFSWTMLFVGRVDNLDFGLV